MDSTTSAISPVESELFNSPPFTIRERDFFIKFKTTSKRADLLAAFERALEKIRLYVDIDCLMVGGSFLSEKDQIPKDIDVSVFYRRKTQAGFDIGVRLAELTLSLRSELIDVRFAPTDSQAWILVKLTSFLTCLYTSQKGSSEFKRNGVLIVVPDDKCI